MLDADSEFRVLWQRSQRKLCDRDNNEKKVEKLVEIPPSFAESVKQANNAKVKVHSKVRDFQLNQPIVVIKFASLAINSAEQNDGESICYDIIKTRKIFSFKISLFFLSTTFDVMIMASTAVGRERKPTERTSLKFHQN